MQQIKSGNLTILIGKSARRSRPNKKGFSVYPFYSAFCENVLFLTTAGYCGGSPSVSAFYPVRSLFFFFTVKRGCSEIKSLAMAVVPPTKAGVKQGGCI